VIHQEEVIVLEALEVLVVVHAQPENTRVLQTTRIVSIVEQVSMHQLQDFQHVTPAVLEPMRHQRQLVLNVVISKLLQMVHLLWEVAPFRTVPLSRFIPTSMDMDTGLTVSAMVWHCPSAKIGMMEDLPVVLQRFQIQQLLHLSPTILLHLLLGLVGLVPHLQQRLSLSLMELRLRLIMLCGIAAILLEQEIASL
jgi:hypothetical protein